MDFALIPDGVRKAQYGDAYLSHGFVYTWSDSVPSCDEYTIYRRVPLARVTVSLPEPRFEVRCPYQHSSNWRIVQGPDGDYVCGWSLEVYPDAEKRAIAECDRLNELDARGEIPT